MSVEAGAAPDSVPLEPSIVARSIDEHPRAEAYDQVIVGYMLQIARELRTASGAEAEALRRRTSKMIAALQPETLRRIVEMGGDTGQRGAFVLDAAHGMAAEAVLDIVKAAADASGQTISHGLVRMLSKLAAHADAAPDHARPMAEEALRDQVGRLLADWHLDDPNPESHGRLLQHLAAVAGASGERSNAWLFQDALDPLGIVQMGLECGATGPMLDRAIDQAIGERKTSALVQLLSSRPDGVQAAADAIEERLRQPGTVSVLMATDPLDFEGLDDLLPLLRADGYEVLLDALISTGNRGTRRRLIERLVRAPVDLRSLIAARLKDDRWYVQRNMLVLLERSGRLPDGFDVSRWTTHPDVRLRSEALRLQLTMPGERDAAIRNTLDDRDSRVVGIGLGAIGRDCPADLIARVARIAEAPDADVELRLLAVAALGRNQSDAALDTLLRLTDGGRTIFGKSRLPTKTPLVVAAIRLLAAAWPSDARAADVVAMAAGSSDAELREAARSLHQ
jgi:hypothetical protein